MKYAIHGFLVVMLAFTSAQLRAETDDQPAEDLPDAVKPFVKLAEQCRMWHARDRNMSWEVIHKQDFAQDPERWPKASRYARIEKTDDKHELIVKAPTGATAFVPVGPKVAGEFAIEIIGRAIGDKQVPLSIMLGNDRGLGPGFQFHARRGDGEQLGGGNR